ncbi:hypothetical protein GC194_07425 [bacterium]|nr:hypothetical protein [bacterium]
MKQVFLVCALVLVTTFGVRAQIALPGGNNNPSSNKSTTTNDDEENPWSIHKFYTGGNFGLQLGSNSYFELSPCLGYKVTEKLWPGVGINYQYYSQKDQSGNRISQSIVGWRAFSSYQVLDNIVAYAEYENLSINYSGNQIFISNVWLGAGLRQWIGEKSAIDMYLLRNSNFGQIQQAFYGSRWNIKMSFLIGL